jgi:hypothetical protein
MEQEANLYQTHEKLDAIWHVISDDYSKRYEDELTSHSSTNFESLLKDWKYWEEMKKEKESVHKQYKVAFQIRVIRYIFGSLLIFFPKLLSDTKKNEVTIRNEEDN